MMTGLFIINKFHPNFNLKSPQNASNIQFATKSELKISTLNVEISFLLRRFCTRCYHSLTDKSIEKRHLSSFNECPSATTENSCKKTFKKKKHFRSIFATAEGWTNVCRGLKVIYTSNNNNMRRCNIYF